MFELGVIAGVGAGLLLAASFAACVVARPIEAQAERIEQVRVKVARLEQVCAVDNYAMTPAKHPANARRIAVR